MADWRAGVREKKSLLTVALASTGKTAKNFPASPSSPGGVKHQVQHRFIELRSWVD
jgi:hypothetical protein